MRSGDREVASAAVCQGPAARASMDKKTPKKNRHPESGRERGGGGALGKGLLQWGTFGGAGGWEGEEGGGGGAPSRLIGVLEGGVGRTQVKERSTHARPGMHMQQCLAVLTAESDAQLSFWLHVHSLSVFCRPQPLACTLTLSNQEQQ